MKKALLSLLARSFAFFLALGGGALRAAAEPYPLWIGGETQVTSDNADDVFSNTTVRFEGDATGGTLFFKDADLRADPPAPFVLFTNILAETGFELAIALEGNNFVRADGDGGHGIYADGGLSLRGGGTLEVGPVPEKAIGTGGAFVVEDGAVVTAQGGSFGIGAVADIVLSNATVTAAGSNSGLYTTGGVMRILGRSTVSASGAQALYAEGGIEIGEGLAVVLPVGGGVSADGTTIVDAAGNTAERVVIAAPGTLLGSGTEADPYVIYDYGTLVAFAEAVNGGQEDAWGVIAADIAATGADWVPIGTNFYSGTFDGAGHVISGLANAGMPAYAGLFGFVDSGGVVRNVRLAGVAFHGECAGGLVGQNGGSVSNCCVSGSVRGEIVAGGVAGVNNGTVTNCYNTGTVTGGSSAGGVVGINFQSVANCHNTGAVSDGGVVGINEGKVKNSYCPGSLGVPAIDDGRDGTVSGECEALTATAYTQTNSFKRWDFTNVWAMGAEGPYLRVLGPTVAYPLWVDGVQVTDVNSGNILGNGTARYAGTKTWGTLMLANAVITNAVEYQSGTSWTAGIYAGDGFELTISLVGSNRVENAREIGEGIYAKGNLLLGGEGSLTVEGVHIGIEVSGTLHIENTTVAVSGLNGFHGENIVLSNATVSAMAGDCGIKTRTVAFTGESRVEVTATNSNGYAVYAFNDITMGDGLSLVEPSGGRVHTSGGHYFIDSNRKPALYVRIEPTAYDLWVDGVQVFSTNAGDILGDGKARFEGTAAGGMLALSNAVVTNAVAYNNLSSAGIYAGDGFDLTISLDGSNQVANAREHGYGILANGNLSLGGAGSLTAEAGRNAEGISAKGNLRIEGTTVAASGVNGVSSGRNIVLTNATVTATGVLDGIYAIGAIAFAGESRVEATATESDGEAIYANDGITLGDRIGVALPVGGRVSEYGTAITDAAGNTATNAIVAYFYDITVVGGSTTNSPSAAGFDIVIIADEPEDGKAFVQWSSNVEGLAFEDAGASPTWFPMPATNVTVTAVSAEIVITWEGETEYTYTGSAITPDFTVSLTNVDLHVGTNYVASWAGNTNAGTATVSVTLTNRPSGVQTNTFRIKPKPLEDEMVQLTVPDAGWWTYTGEALQPGFSLSDGNPGALTTNDVVLSWSNNVGPGIATAVFAGTNNYAGRVVKEFEIRWASETVDGTAWSYRSDLGGGTSATVTGADPAEGDLAVPETLGGLPVAGIGDGAFAGAANLTSVTIPDGVADIGEEAFAGCTALTNVWIGTGIESVGTNAFAGCDALAEVWVPVEQEGTGLLDAAGLPAGCEIHYYGTQVVTFDANGGTCGTASREYARGEPFGSLPEAERPFHDFAGWMTPEGIPVTADTPATASFRFLVARWNGRRGVFITTQPESQTVPAGESVTLSVGIRNQAGFRVPLGWGNEVEMLFCPAGTFEMGSPESELGREARYSYRNPDETRHTVVLTHDFWLSRTEITQKQYKDGVMGTNPSAHKEEGRTDLPVDSVSWRDSTNFCLRLTGNEKSAGRLPKGYVFALPTEAEWEYACRAETTNALASGEELSNTVSCPEMDKVGWYKSNSLSQTHAVGTIWTNAWGFSDMHGNVSEWCWDFYKAEYPTGTVVNPAGPGLPVDGDTFRIHRGGSWNAEAGECRSAARGCDQPSHGGNERGFRLALVRSRDLSVPLRDDLSLELTAVNPDTFQMGSPDGELGRNTDETRHAVTLTKVYWIGKHEVSQAQWLEVMGSYPEAFDGSVHGQGDELPVYATSHAEAVEFCELLTERERAAGRLPAGYRFALPTEAQWEYACRGGTTKALNNDHDLHTTTGQCTSLDQVAWYLYNAGGRVHSIHDHKEANSSAQYGGVFQPHSCMEGMHGNVREWVADWYGVYPAEAVTDPEGPATGTERILRGGGIDDEPADCRSAARIRSPGGAATGTSGLRVVLVPVAGVPRNPDALYPPPEPWDRTSRGESYQWFRDGTPIEGATGASLSIPYAKSSDAGRYTVAVTAGGMSATSAVAVLRVRMESEVVGGVTWYYVTNAAGGATVTEVDPPAGDLAMPETLGGLAVTEVGGGAFENCTNLTGMAIASGVTNIGAAAFQGCSALAKVWVPIEKKGTDLLANTELPDTCEIHYYGEQVVTFDGNGGTPERTTNSYTIGEPYGNLPEPAWQLHTFDGWQATNGAAVAATNLVTEEAARTLVAQWSDGVVVGNVLWLCTTNADGGVTVTGIDPAEGDLAMPGTLDGFAVTAVGDHAFDGCTNLTGMAIAPGVTNIGEGAFADCIRLATADLPEGLVSIGSGAFGHTALTDVAIPDSVATIGEEAFEGCTSLTNVWLGTEIESVGTNAFLNCDALETIWVPVEKQGTGLLDEAALPGTCEIHWYGTQVVTFDPNGGSCATETNAYTIGETYGSLPMPAWQLHTFDGWQATNGAAVAATSLVTEEAARMLVARWTEGVVVSNVLWLCTTNADGGVTVTGIDPAEGDVAIPAALDGFSVTAVGPQAFQGCTNVTGIAVPDGVADIGESAFDGCSALTNVCFGAGVTNIGEGAFADCTRLATADLPEGLVSIGSGAFGHTALADVAIPDSVATIGEEAFALCASLTNVWLGTGIGSVGTNACLNCDALETIWVPVEQQGTDLLSGAGVPEGCEIHWYGTQVVTFEPEGGSCAVAADAYAIGSPYGDLPEPARAGYEFLGWHDAAGGGTQITAESLVTEEAARTLHAHWQTEPLTVWRFYSKKAQGHFYTISEAEKARLVASDPDWTFEGGAWKGFTNRVPGTAALHRFRSNRSGGWFYTVSEAEKASLAGNPNWSYDGVACYAYPGEHAGCVPVYRFWSAKYNRHFYTTSAAEKEELIASHPNWKYERVAFWARPQGGAAADPATAWRFHSERDQAHRYTVSETERDELLAAGGDWKFEGGVWRAFTDRAAGTVPLYRFRSTKHRNRFYTAGAAEKDALAAGNANWKYDGVDCYVYPVAGEGRVPVYRFWSKKHNHHFYTADEREKESLLAAKGNWKYEKIAFWALPREGAAGAGNDGVPRPNAAGEGIPAERPEAAGAASAPSGAPAVAASAAERVFGVDDCGVFAVGTYLLAISPDPPAVEELADREEAAESAPPPAVAFRVPEGAAAWQFWSAERGVLGDADVSGPTVVLKLPDFGLWHWLRFFGADGATLSSTWLFPAE